MMIRIFAMKVSRQDFTDPKWRCWLSGERLEQARRIKSGKQQQIYLGAEVLLNRSLERIGAGLSLPAVYTRTVHGKPYLYGQKGLYVNWSHSKDCVLCGLSDQEIGVDLQYMEKEPKKALVYRVLQPEERIFYEQAASGQQKVLFYQYWAVKESYLKARGTGFSAPLDAFYVRMEGAYPEVVQRDQKTGWTCRLLNAAEGYAAAVCTEGVQDLRADIPVEWTGSEI